MTSNESNLQVLEDTNNPGFYVLNVLQMKRINPGINNVLLHWSSSAGTDPTSSLLGLLLKLRELSMTLLMLHWHFSGSSLQKYRLHSLC